ncbi:MAG: hypothetical protein WC679_02620 [Bacteroidales bacterium]|jgi:hypothetical protein
MKLDKFLVLETRQNKTHYSCYIIPAFYGNSFKTFTILYEYAASLFSLKPNDVECSRVLKSRWYANMSIIAFSITEEEFEIAKENGFDVIKDISYYIEEWV